MFHDGGFYMVGMHGLWWIFWIVLIGLVLFLAWGRPGTGRRRTDETPLAVLQQRLARGEITPDEYEKRKSMLERDGARG